ncbi:MAG: hypothetical protein CFE44_14055 [Burkholderiales bacterium PBB4]|nr:MAG: hypothetical protein CFE44_14055 [Burkholderiales bacterium PBB4]
MQFWKAKTRAIGCIGVAWLAGTPGVVTANEPTAPAAPLPIIHYVKPPEFAAVTLSPDGRYLATLSPQKGKRNLVVLDLETKRPRAVTSFSNFDVISYNWVGSSFLVFSLGTLDTPTGAESGQGGGLFAVRPDGSGYRKISPTVEEQLGSGSTVYRSLRYLRAVPGSQSEMIAIGKLRTDRDDVYRVDLMTGKQTLLTFDAPGIVDRWILDNDAQPRAVVVRNKDDVPAEELVRKVLIRDTLESPWRTVAEFTHADRAHAWTAVGFAADNRKLMVDSSADRPPTARFVYETDTQKLGEVLFAHPRYDVSEATFLRDANTRQIVGVQLDGETAEVRYVDPQYAQLHKALEPVFKGQVVQLQRATNGKTLVVAFSDRHPHTYHLYDEATKNLAPLLRSRPDLSSPHLVEMRPFLLKTRDGLEIPSYYFLPAQHLPGQRLPTVVSIHGGPHVRADYWGPPSGGVAQAQLLASRGYAVVLPNHRITPGLGKAVFEAGWGQVGRKMSDDHEDAARWAVEQGFADPQRICITGGSYGGYATLWASVRSSAVFRCGAAGFAISDMELQQKSTLTDYTRSRAGVAEWKRLLGVKGEDWAPAREVSPVWFADQSGFPLFIFAGGADRRTPIEQTKLMVSALERAGKPPALLLVKADEAHGYGQTSNRVELHEAMLKFFDAQIGSGWSAKASSPSAH